MSSTRSQLAIAALVSLSSALPQGYPLRPTGTGTGGFYPTGNATGIWSYPTGSYSGYSATGIQTDIFTSIITYTNLYSETVVETVTGAAVTSDSGAAFTSDSGSCASEVTSTVTEQVTVTVSAAAEAQSSYVFNLPSGSSSIVIPVVASSQVSSVAAGVSSHRHGHGHSRFHSSTGIISTSVPVYSSPVSSVAVAAVSTTAVVYSTPAPVESSAAPVVSSAAAAVSSAPVYTSAVAVPSTTAVVTSIPVPTSVAAVPTTTAAAVSSAPAYSSAVVSTAAAASGTCSSRPAAPAVGTSGKRGASYNNAALCDAFSGSSQITWAYNWSDDEGDLPSSLEYVPQMWGLTSGETDSFNQTIKEGGYKTILGFNEPDMYLSTSSEKQADMTPQEAVNAWPWVEQFACQARLGSPAVTNGVDGMGFDYLDSFFSLCKDCTIDFVVLHWYGSYQAVDDLKNHVDQAWTKYGKPIWITEFEPTDGDDDQKASFLKDAMTYLDNNEHVERYAYFGVFDGSLLDGTTANVVGETYAA